MNNPGRRAGLAQVLIPALFLFAGATVQAADNSPASATAGAIPSDEKLLDQPALTSLLADKYLYPTTPSAANASLNEFFFKDGAWKLSSGQLKYDGRYTVLENSYCVRRDTTELCFAVTSKPGNIYRLYRASNGAYSYMFDVTISDSFHGVKGPPAP